MNGTSGLSPIIGSSAAMRRARDLVERFAPTALPILLVGATGTGKELLAQHIHLRSGRCGRFVPVNCGAIPRDMAEGLLFGYERGAFSGALRRHRGYFECADGGTLFLDELLSLPLEGQAKLLRSLDTGEIQRLGEESERLVDARVVAAVHEGIEARMAAGSVRRDLCQRLSGLIIELPPLAERREDIPQLAAYFAERQGQMLDRAALHVIVRHGWPGNVRELRQVIQRAGCLVENGTVPAEAVWEAMRLGAPQGERVVVEPPGKATIDDAESIVSACRAHAWNLSAAARALRFSRSTLYRKLAKMGLSGSQVRHLQ